MHGKIALLTLALAAATHSAYAGELAPRPPGYPTEYMHDSFAARPTADTFADRRQAYFDLTLKSRGNGPFSEAVRLYHGQLPDEQQIQWPLGRMAERRDCADFALQGILRILYQFPDSPLLSDTIKAQCREGVLNFKYWPDEPGIDSMCTWSENHLILFSTAGYLAGQLYPDETFTNSGRTGREQMDRFRPRVMRWLDLRFRTGFSEWLSNVYYNEDLPPLLNLVDFCEDEEIAERARMVVDLLVADMALNTFRGSFASAHGRTYEREKKSGTSDHIGSVQKLLFGVSRFSLGNMSTVHFALSPKYRMPKVFESIAWDTEQPEYLNRQRMGIDIDDAPKFGLDYDLLEDGMFFFGLEAYSHRKTINNSLRMFDEYNMWDNSFFEGFKKQKKIIDAGRKLHAMPLICWYFRKDLTRNMRNAANIHTYRTPDYMLSTAQDHRPGFGGDQQSIWQATLSPETTCFTTHPARIRGKSPSYWVGYGSLPRCAQTGNVVVSLYKINTRPGLYVTHELLFTHAFFPRDRFDEVHEQDGWIFGRKGDGYIALWSQQPYHWQQDRENDPDKREVIAHGKTNIWICELGRRAEVGSFETFMDRILGATLWTRGLSVWYESPSQGRLEFDWRGPFKQNGAVVNLDDYPRYDNPYGHAEYPSTHIEFEHKGEWLKLDWDSRQRTASAFVSVGE
ncbi:MAG: hypothetical protein GY851_28990 [bacterium]|nr:hypothetical protein [bacterium]